MLAVSLLLPGEPQEQPFYRFPVRKAFSAHHVTSSYSCFTSLYVWDPFSSNNERGLIVF